MVDVSIIILHYKSIKKTVKCLDSIRSSELGDLRIEIIVVDNGSGDDIENVLKNKYSEVQLIKSKKNLGMGGGNNLGIIRAGGKYLFVLNDDIVIRPNTIKALYKKINSDEHIGLIAPRLNYPNGELQPTCFRFPRVYTPFLRRTFLGNIFKNKLKEYTYNYFSGDRTRECDYIFGACVMARKSVLDRIGFFDERFFMYFEDADLCRRIWNAGYKVLYFHKAAAVHDHGRASARHPWFLAPFTNKLAREHIKSWVKYFWKWR